MGCKNTFKIKTYWFFPPHGVYPKVGKMRYNSILSSIAMNGFRVLVVGFYSYYGL